MPRTWFGAGSTVVNIEENAMKKFCMMVLAAVSASAWPCADAQQLDPREGFGYAMKGATSYSQRVQDVKDTSQQIASRPSSAYNDTRAKDWTDRPAQPDDQQIRNNPMKVQINVPPPPQQETGFYDTASPYGDPWAVDPRSGYSHCELYLYYSKFDPTIEVPAVCNDKRAQQVHRMQGVARQIKQLSDSYRPSNTAVTQATYVRVQDQGAVQDAAAAQGIPGSVGAAAAGAQQGNPQQGNH
jgi:hypothetical protein